VPGAAHRLTIHRRRPCPPGAVPDQRTPTKPRSHRSVQRPSIDGFQDPPGSGLILRLEPPGQEITADPQRGHDLRRRVRDLLTAPAGAWATLLDEGIYLGSVSVLNRVMREAPPGTNKRNKSSVACGIRHEVPDLWCPDDRARSDQRTPSPKLS
jgi:hypothetical protein